MPNPVMTRAVEALASGRHMSADHASAVLHEVMEGRSSEVETAAFLIALRTKGETVDEVEGLAVTMRELAVPVKIDRAPLVDTAGTGGGAPTFNVSTTAAFVAAGAGCAVAKHGNRSATGRSGSADVLEALGARIDLEPDAVASCIDEVGFGFMFAPHHHQAMRHVVPVRRELGVRTIFNFLGPLTNPAGATRQVIGVSDPGYIETIAAALRSLGGRTALVVSSEDGLDEISVSGAPRAARWSASWRARRRHERTAGRAGGGHAYSPRGAKARALPGRARAAPARRGHRPAVRGGAVAARDVGDRGVQAALALGRADP